MNEIEVTEEEIQADLKEINEMKVDATPMKVKGLRHQPPQNKDAKRKHKIQLQKEARKAQRGK